MKIEHIGLYVRDLETARHFFETYFAATSSVLYHNQKTGFQSYFLTFSEGARLEKDGYLVLSGPRVTGDGYYESNIQAFEGNQIELTV